MAPLQSAGPGRPLLTAFAAISATISAAVVTVAWPCPALGQKPAYRLARETVIFTKPLPGQGRLVVTCKEIEDKVSPEELARRAEAQRRAPGANYYSDHMYTYSFVLRPPVGPAHTLWTLRQGTFGPIDPGKTDPASGSIEVLDAALNDNTLCLLVLQFERACAIIVRTDRRRAPHGPQWDSWRSLERSGAFDFVSSGHIVASDAGGRLAIELGHHVKLDKGATRVTVYHLGTDEKGEADWLPDPANHYIGGEMSGYELRLRLRRAEERQADNKTGAP